MSKRTLATWEDALDVTLSDLRALMVERHTKYGPENINAWGELGCLVRLSDKVARLKHMHGDHLDESTEDAWRDAANYAVIALMVRSGGWTFPAECLMDTTFCGITTPHDPHHGIEGLCAGVTVTLLP